MIPSVVCRDSSVSADTHLPGTEMNRYSTVHVDEGYWSSFCVQA